jgi:hypothetical protein
MLGTCAVEFKIVTGFVLRVGIVAPGRSLRFGGKASVVNRVGRGPGRQDCRPIEWPLSTIEAFGG